MTKPPAGSSLLFGALADSGQIKQRKNGSYRMVLKGIDEIDWFTDRPNRVDGTWKPKKLLRRWDQYFATSEPNAQITFEADDQKTLATFELFKPRAKKQDVLAFKIKPISQSSEKTFDQLILNNKNIRDVSLFIDDADDLSSGDAIDSLPKTGIDDTGFGGVGNGGDLVGFKSRGADWTDLSFPRADFRKTDNQCSLFLRTSMFGADFSNASLFSSLMVETNLQGAEFQGVDANSALFSGANLKGATYGGQLMTPDNLSKAPKVEKTIFDGSKIEVTAEYIFDGSVFIDVTCPDGSNSNDNPGCGFSGVISAESALPNYPAVNKVSTDPSIWMYQQSKSIHTHCLNDCNNW